MIPFRHTYLGSGDGDGGDGDGDGGDGDGNGGGDDGQYLLSCRVMISMDERNPRLAGSRIADSSIE